MKLRNKKTGGIGELYYYPEKEYCFNIVTEDPADMMIYKTIGGIWYDWEDYIPDEPLIKDEKIRKAVRAWAEANSIRAVYYSPDEQGFYVKNFDGEIVAAIYFGDTPMEEDGYNEHYTIAELCGEDEK